MRETDLKRLDSIKVSKNTVDFIVMHYLIRDIKSSIAKFATGNLLDVGCGNKPYESLFENKLSSYTGCDVVQSNANKVDVICLATNLDFEDNKFDTVFSTQVMEHVDNSDKMMGECNRVLKTDGHLILSVPFCWELHEEPYDFFRFTKYGLTELCKRNNFEVIEIVANGGKWAAIMQMNLNMIYSSFKRKSFSSKLLKGLFINLHLTQLLNWLAIKIDKKYFDSLLTLNYVLIAKKK